MATLIETGDGVRIAATGYQLPPGRHGLHLDAVGTCAPPDFASAGVHFDPGSKQHGRHLNPVGPDTGDLPNLLVVASGEGGIDITTKAITLAPGPPSLSGEKEAAIVVHAAGDDDKTDSAGDGGARIACGVVAK